MTSTPQKADAGRFVSLPANLLGRDFVTTDMHGCVHLVEQGLERVRFDPARDRLFVPGDAIDRGPYSARSAVFLRRPGVHALLGNHEAMLLDLYSQGEPDEAVLAFFARQNGFAWWMSTPDSVRADVLDAIKDLPYAIETRTFRGSVGFVHAEVPLGMDWPTFRQAVMEGHPKVLEQAIWGRTRIKRQDRQGVSGIDRLFVGHSIVDQPARLGNVFYIDTGASSGVKHGGDGRQGRMTMARLVCATQVLGDAQPTNARDLVDVRDGSAPWKFGEYARLP